MATIVNSAWASAGGLGSGAADHVAGSTLSDDHIKALLQHLMQQAKVDAPAAAAGAGAGGAAADTTAAAAAGDSMDVDGKEEGVHVSVRPSTCAQKTFLTFVHYLVRS